MAELIAGAFLSSFFQFTLERFASRDFKDIFHKGLVERLEITLNSINQLLDDAETKQYQNPHVTNWLDQLKHVVYEVDQLLDKISTKVRRQSKGKRLFSTLTNPFESRIKDLLGKLNFLAEQKDVLGLKEERLSHNELDVGLKYSIRLPMTSLVDESNIFGRKGDKEEIINFLLLDNGISNHTPLISIIGLGGMGKTTLAQIVYNDHMIQKSFDLKAWVYVSESFNVVGLTKAILESFDCSPNSENLEPLQRQLQQKLAGRKYLLVLDDVWNGEIWDRLLLPFNKGSPGSKIIVTTRNREVATSMKSTMLLDLKRLEESDCWSLFVKLAFHNRNVSEYPIFESIGKNIVDKCGGLPLAVKTLGNLLRRKFSQSEWVKILETDLWCLSESDSKINPVLRLSYHNLPSNLKRCFAYCSIFPKGYKYDKNQLINLWMAEGLLKCCRGDKSEEELGNESFNDLESISFFQQSLYLGVKCYIMHDLVNDLAKSESQKFCLQIEGDTVQDISERTRHIWCSLDFKDDARISNQICKIKGLRSLLVERQFYQGEQIMISNNLQRDIFSKLKYLRMLSFRGCELTMLADKIGTLKLLRYLDLTRTKITSLPDSICELYNLETLILEECSELTELPLNFYKLVCLRHLYLNGTYIKKMPKKIGTLNHLQTMSHFVVGEKREFDIKELDNLNLLEGKLSISGLEHVINPADAAEANMKDKKHLEELSVNYSENFKFNNNGRELDVLEAFQPNSNLKRLTIEHYNGNSFPNWLRDCHLPNLASLKLQHCKLCSHLPPLGQLPFLKELFISHCDGINIIGKEFYDNSNSTSLPFRSLEVLEFKQMENWEEWLCLEGFPLLKVLSITNCPKLKRAPPQHLPSLQILKISDCKMLEASITKGDSIIELCLERCDRILINELPTSLKHFVLWQNRYTEFSAEQNLLNSTNLVELKFDFSGFVKHPSLDLHCYNSVGLLGLRGWRSLSFPFELHLFTNLISLLLNDFPEMESFPRGGLPSNLQLLVIRNFPKLISLGGEDWNLFKLNSFYLADCPELESFPRGGLPADLRLLEIQNCPKLIASRMEWGLFQLNSLKFFKVSDHEFENVDSFPEENLLPPTLVSLSLTNCSKLKIMNYKGFLHLKSLKDLMILNCPSLERLPEEGLPSSISRLRISDCPLIKEKYEKEGGVRIALA
ncbi:putative disease resistance RPP13-like protein 1 [Trifolium pratense]|uniref:putative disease resistance RPP13-like protein 1 n=1 Tax=Trifolium pratense TaxID=57577 RepID=UPI001E69176A|nr:putative disease resistance RPP13-like protein 1 [Trifolium pratense]